MKRKIKVFSIAYAEAWAWGVGATLLGLGISVVFFRESMIMAASGLTSFALIFEMNKLLNENRDAIWLHKAPSLEANSVLTMKVTALFFGILLATLGCQLIAPKAFLYPVAPANLFFSNEAMPLFLHNLRVLTACLILAVIYRAAGILLVISWNAINWSTALLVFIHTASETGARHAWFYALSVLPHLILEATAYVTAGMSGVFMSKGLFKYRLSSKKFFLVSRASAAILAVSVACLWLAMNLEIGLAQAIMAQLKK